MVVREPEPTVQHAFESSSSSSIVAVGKEKQPTSSSSIRDVRQQQSSSSSSSSSDTSQPTPLGSRPWWPCGSLDEQEAAQVVDALVLVLTALVDRFEKEKADGRTVPLTRFHANQAPNISVQQYLLRILRYAPCSRECFVLALIYIHKILELNPDFVVDSLTVHRVFITSILVASKTYDDAVVSNDYYARVGGIPCSEINTLEVKFIFLIEFSLIVDESIYGMYQRSLLAPNPIAAMDSLLAHLSSIERHRANSASSDETMLEVPLQAVPDTCNDAYAYPSPPVSYNSSPVISEAPPSVCGRNLRANAAVASTSASATNVDTREICRSNDPRDADRREMDAGRFSYAAKSKHRLNPVVIVDDHHQRPCTKASRNMAESPAYASRDCRIRNSSEYLVDC